MIPDAFYKRLGPYFKPLVQVARHISLKATIRCELYTIFLHLVFVLNYTNDNKLLGSKNLIFGLSWCDTSLFYNDHQRKSILK